MCTFMYGLKVDSSTGRERTCMSRVEPAKALAAAGEMLLYDI